MKKTISWIATVIMAITSFFGISANEVGTTKAPQSVEQMSAKDHKWVYGILESYDLPKIDGLQIAVTDQNNCGSESSPEKTGGGCFFPTENILLLSPSIIRTDRGIITLLHEYGHAMGLLDECDAEFFAHDIFETNLWSYKECFNEYYGV